MPLDFSISLINFSPNLPSFISYKKFFLFICSNTLSTFCLVIFIFLSMLYFLKYNSSSNSSDIGLILTFNSYP